MPYLNSGTGDWVRENLQYLLVVSATQVMLSAEDSVHINMLCRCANVTSILMLQLESQLQPGDERRASYRTHMLKYMLKAYHPANRAPRMRGLSLGASGAEATCAFSGLHRYVSSCIDRCDRLIVTGGGHCS